MTLSFWNSLTRSHLTDVVMVLTATILALIDIPLREKVKKAFKGKSPVIRFTAFVALCSVGFAAIAMGTSWVLKFVLLLYKGAYLAPTALFILIAVGVIAARQKEF